MPWRRLLLVCAALTMCRGVSLHAWKLFSRLLLSETDDKTDKTLSLYRFRQHICRPGVGLGRYLEPLKSATTEFLTHLVISGGCDFDTHEMLQLADLRTLAVLELIRPSDELRAFSPDVSDRLIRGWTEKDDPFPLLRILRIWGDPSVTQDSLQWVSRFPSLVLYDVMAAREDWKAVAGRAHDSGWDLAEPIRGLEDSLLRYLMLFAPIETGFSNRLQELSRGIDSDLASLCSDSGCSVKFVPAPQAPPLVDYLADTAKVVVAPAWDADAAARDARDCHGVAFEAFGFWLYSFVGQLSEDADLRSCGVRCDTQAVVGPFVLPSKRMACVYLGHSGRGGISSKPSYVTRGLFSTQRYTFTRPATASRQGGNAPAPMPAAELRNAVPKKAEPILRPSKKQRLADVLESLSSRTQTGAVP